jgi:hypothetical protein
MHQQEISASGIRRAFDEHHRNRASRASPLNLYDRGDFANRRAEEKTADGWVAFEKRWASMSNAEKLQKTMNAASELYKKLPDWVKKQTTASSAAVERSVRPMSENRKRR